MSGQRLSDCFARQRSDQVRALLKLAVVCPLVRVETVRSIDPGVTGWAQAHR